MAARLLTLQKVVYNFYPLLLIIRKVKGLRLNLLYKIKAHIGLYKCCKEHLNLSCEVKLSTSGLLGPKKLNTTPLVYFYGAGKNIDRKMRLTPTYSQIIWLQLESRYFKIGPQMAEL